jgi:hypothetical protein
LSVSTATVEAAAAVGTRAENIVKSAMFTIDAERVVAFCSLKGLIEI